MKIRCPRVVLSRSVSLHPSSFVRQPTLKLSCSKIHFQLQSDWKTHNRFLTTQITNNNVSANNQPEQPKKIKVHEEPETKMAKITDKMTMAMKKKKYSQVWGYFNRLKHEKISPNKFQHTLAIEAYAKQSKIDKVTELFEEMKQTCGLSVRAYNALIECKGKCTHKFDEEKWKECLSLVEDMKNRSLYPSTFTYEILMKVINPQKMVRSNTFPLETRMEIAQKLFEECGRKRIPYTSQMFVNLLIGFKTLGKWHDIAKMYDVLVKSGTRANLFCLNLFWQAFRMLGDTEMAATVERIRSERMESLLTRINDPAAVKRTMFIQEKLWQNLQQDAHAKSAESSPSQ